MRTEIKTKIEIEKQGVLFDIDEVVDSGLLTTAQLQEYDHVIVAYSGGKDCTACLLHLLEAGVEKDKIELWHHDIDGREGDHLMDWPITTGYCEQFAKEMNLPLYYSWKVGGFSREMLRNDSLTAPTRWENPDGTIGQAGGSRGKRGTRMKFPQVSDNLATRWCSAYLKIDVCSAAIRNQERFNNKKTLLVSGERAEESAGRAGYKIFEPDRADNRDGRTGRHADRYRPVHRWTEAEVWEIIERWKIRVHPAYYIGWARVSCASCIFGSKNQWATLNKVSPDHVKKIAEYEKLFGVTINRDKRTVEELVNEGTPYNGISNEEQVAQSMKKEYNHSIFMDEWELPAGAFGESCGPA